MVEIAQNRCVYDYKSRLIYVMIDTSEEKATN